MNRKFKIKKKFEIKICFNIINVFIVIFYQFNSTHFFKKKKLTPYFVTVVYVTLSTAVCNLNYIYKYNYYLYYYTA